VVDEAKDNEKGCFYFQKGAKKGIVEVLARYRTGENQEVGEEN
jgi:hypothetical protein